MTRPILPVLAALALLLPPRGPEGGLLLVRDPPAPTWPGGGVPVLVRPRVVGIPEHPKQMARADGALRDRERAHPRGLRAGEGGVQGIGPVVGRAVVDVPEPPPGSLGVQLPPVEVVPEVVDAHRLRERERRLESLIVLEQVVVGQHLPRMPLCSRA